MPRRKSFAGAVCVVTGAASGIGLELARQLAAAGAHVALADIDADGVAAAAQALGDAAVAHPLDVTDAEGVAALVRDVHARHGRLDYLFNNAGINVLGEAQRLTRADWQRLLDVNLAGVVNGVHAAYPLMVEQGFGHIVNTASTAALVPSPFIVAYAMTKSGVLGLSVSLRAEARRYGVSVSVACPGFIDTPMNDRQTYLGVERTRALAKVPVRLYPADRCARDILKGVLRDRELIVVTWFARWVFRLRRWFPGVAAWVAARVARKGL